MHVPIPIPLRLLGQLNNQIMKKNITLLLLVVYSVSGITQTVKPTFEKGTPKPKEFPFGNPSDTTRGFYGLDDRKEVEDVDWIEDYTRATAVMIRKSDLKGNKLYAPTLRTELEYIHKTKKFEGVKYLDQPIAAYCSGFLIAPDILVTAGHCIETMEDANDFLWLFDYTMDNNYNPSTGYLTVDLNNVYEVKEVMDAWLYDGYRSDDDLNMINVNYDYSYLKLNRESDRKPYRFRTSGDVTWFTDMYTIGCPSGLPLKLTDNAFVVDNEPYEWFKTNIDGFPGNSGGPVFDELGWIEGIHVRGSIKFSKERDKWTGDYIYDKDCDCVKTVSWAGTFEASTDESVVIGSQEHRIGYMKDRSVLTEAIYNNVDYAIRHNNLDRLNFWMAYSWIVASDYAQENGRFERTAVKNNNLEILKVLYNNGGTVALSDAKGRSFLFDAIENKNSELLVYLLKKGISPNKADSKGNYPIHYALDKGQISMIETLIKRGAKINVNDTYGSSLLHEAVYMNNIDLVKLLISKGADYSALDSDGRTPLKLAKKNKYKTLKKYLKRVKKGKA
jgi:V8-like Glu-specific endopeptidase